MKKSQNAFLQVHPNPAYTRTVSHSNDALSVENNTIEELENEVPMPEETKGR